MNLFSGDHYSNGRIEVALDRATAQPGETLQGYVQLEVTGEFSCAELSLTFAGVARSMVMHTERVQPGSMGVENQGMDTIDQPQTGGTQQRMAVESQSVCKLQAQLASFPGGVAEMGVYQFPFQLPIPEDIPATVAHVKGTASNAQLLYTLSVKAGRPNFACVDVVKEVPVDISVPVPPHLAGLHPQFLCDTGHVMTCCCCKKGEVTVGAQLGRECFLTSDEITLWWQMKNCSGVKVEGVQARLVRDLVISSRGHHKHAKSTQVDQSIRGKVPIGAWIGFGLEQEAKNGLRRNLSRVSLSRKSGSVSGQTPLTDMLTTTIPIPDDCLPSTAVKGMLTIGYVVEVEAKTNLFSTNPKIHLPILLYRQAPVPAESWEGAEGHGGGALGVPVTYAPNPSAKTTPVEVHMGWTVVSDEEEPAGALYEFAGYSASAGGA